MLAFVAVVTLLACKLAIDFADNRSARRWQRYTAALVRCA